MTIKKKYRLKKRIKSFLIFYTVICSLFVASYTFSKYTMVAQGTGGIDIAKFNVVINDIDVTESKPIQFNFGGKSTFTKEKIAPNNEGYFEFILNPSKTEVSLEYEFKFNIDEFDEDFKLTYFTINDGDTQSIINNVVKNDLLLPLNEQGFTEHGFTDNDKIILKVYWSWEKEEDIVNPDINDYENKNINVIVIVKQKLK